ncbi:hypothetical protein Syun_014291 [Stephania yunnanensis]|uniref:Uncharacterized protein n=1 Tax=Stephania yunnanensis TaxID=152371 RepID=A0AAP0JJ24_9MAGN
MKARQIRLSLVESDVKKISTWPDLVSSGSIPTKKVSIWPDQISWKPIPADLHFVVINFGRNNMLVATTKSCVVIAIKIGATYPSMEPKSPLHNEFQQIYRLAKIAFHVMTLRPSPWPPPSFHSTIISTFNLAVFLCCWADFLAVFLCCWADFSKVYVSVDIWLTMGNKTDELGAEDTR